MNADEAFVCEACGARWYYTRERCHDCGGREFETYRLDAGELVAVTTAHVTPEDVRSPNRLGIARFDGVRVTAQLADGDAEPGDAVVFAGRHALREGGPRQPRLTRPNVD